MASKTNNNSGGLRTELKKLAREMNDMRRLLDAFTLSERLNGVAARVARLEADRAER